MAGETSLPFILPVLGFVGGAVGGDLLIARDR